MIDRTTIINFLEQQIAHHIACLEFFKEQLDATTGPDYWKNWIVGHSPDSKNQEGVKS